MALREASGDPAAGDSFSRAGTAEGAAAAARLGVAVFVLVALTTGLIVLGALVRAHGAGLACPDWPLCFGQVLPEMDLKVAFEWGHRAAVAGISLLFLGLGAAIARRPTTRRLAGRIWCVAAAVFAVQILLGALTVWRLLAEWTVTSHLITGNALNVCFFVMGLALYEGAGRASRARIPASAQLGVAGVAGLLLLQMLLGGLVSSSYAGLACPEWPTCNGGQWFPSWQGSVGLHLLHRLNGYLLLAGLGLAAWWSRGQGRLGAACALALILGLAQVGVGIANVLTGIPVEVTALHSALAALLVLNLAFACREVWLARG